jgi:hypothetical protein
MAGGSLSSVKLSRIARVSRAFQLRIAGNSFREIAEIIKQEFKQIAIDQYRLQGWTEAQIALEISINNPLAKYDFSAARRDVQKGLVETRNNSIDDAKSIRDLECVRLDDMLAAIYQGALAGDLASVDRVLKIIELRAKLLGTNSPIDIRMKEIIYHRVECQFNLLFEKIEGDRSIPESVKEKLMILASTIEPVTEGEDWTA